MPRLRDTFVALLLAGCCASVMGCIGGPSPVYEGEDEALGNYEAMFADAPDNDTLPEIGKADSVYPKQFTELVRLNSPVRSQGSRGVCSIFATVAYMEHLYVKKGFANPDFSEQYLQWSVKNEVGSFQHTEGSNSSSNLRAITTYGIVEEPAWPYETIRWSAADDPECGKPEEERPIRCFTNGDPPASAQNAQKYYLPSSSWLNTRSIKHHMTAKKTGVVVGLTFFYQAWNHRKSTLPVTSSYTSQGYVLFPNEEDQEKSLEKRAGHAILLLGWDDELEVQTRDATGAGVVDEEGNPVMEKGFYIFKNSWGTSSFGIRNPHGPGYGFISMKYVERWGSAVVAEVPDLDPPNEDCTDGIDNNHNDLVDCDDPLCAADPACDDAGDLHGEVSPNAAIPDNDPTGTVSEISLTSDEEVASVKVTVEITHTYIGDLAVLLSHDNEVVILHNNEGGSSENLSKTYTVEEFAGLPAGGVWRLDVIDYANMDSGQLNFWSIDVTTR